MFKSLTLTFLKNYISNNILFLNVQDIAGKNTQFSSNRKMGKNIQEMRMMFIIPTLDFEKICGNNIYFHQIGQMELFQITSIDIKSKVLHLSCIECFKLT